LERFVQLTSLQPGRFRLLTGTALRDGKSAGFTTGMAALDALLPQSGLDHGAIHEILSRPSDGVPRYFTLLLARAAANNRIVVWSDPQGEIYPPALSATGLSLDRMVLLRARNPRDELWATAECLRCKGVAVTIAAPKRLSRVEARRLQLAAERGGGVGLLLRQVGASSAHYAAATRWLVEPAPGDRFVQRWHVQLVHGHGGRLGQPITLEVCRDTNHVRAIETVADRSGEAAATARASA
jgi:protein ImuA